jgi:hypothetical protein
MLCRFRIEQSGHGTTQSDWQALEQHTEQWVKTQVFDHHCLRTSPHDADTLNSSQHCFGLWQQSRVSLNWPRMNSLSLFAGHNLLYAPDIRRDVSGGRILPFPGQPIEKVGDLVQSIS